MRLGFFLQRQHASLRRTLRPLHLVEGTEVSGLRNGEVTLLGVNDTDPAVYFNVKLKPLKVSCCTDGGPRSGPRAVRAVVKLLLPTPC